jgi:hypothetical protein
MLPHIGFQKVPVLIPAVDTNTEIKTIISSLEKGVEPALETAYMCICLR